MAGEGSSDHSDAITKSFDQYEYVAVIVPGAALLLGLHMVWPEHLALTADREITLGTFGMFVIAAFVVGQILRAIGDLAEKGFWWLFGGMPTEWVLEDIPNLVGPSPVQEFKPKLLDEDQTKRLNASLKLNKPIDRKNYNSDEWQAETRQIYSKVRQAGQSGRIDAFNRTLGMMNGLTVALVLIALAFGIKALCSAPAWQHPALFAAVALVLAALTLYRFYIFGKLYGRELFVQFLALKPEQRA